MDTLNPRLTEIKSWYISIKESFLADGDLTFSPDSINYLMKVVKPNEEKKVRDLVIRWEEFYLNCKEPFNSGEVVLLKLYYMLSIKKPILKVWDLKKLKISETKSLLDLILILDYDSKFNNDTLFSAVLDYITNNLTARQVKQFKIDDLIQGFIPSTSSPASSQGSEKSRRGTPDYQSPIDSPTMKQIGDFNACGFDFLVTEPDSSLYCHIIKKDYLLCLLKSHCFGEEITKINDMSFPQAWEYCDKTIFIPQLDVRRSNYSKENKDKSDFLVTKICDLIEEREKSRVSGPNVTPVIADQLSSVMKKLKDIEIQLISGGTSRPNVSIAAPVFVPPTRALTSKSQEDSTQGSRNLSIGQKFSF